MFKGMNGRTNNDKKLALAALAAFGLAACDNNSDRMTHSARTGVSYANYEDCLRSANLAGVENPLRTCNAQSPNPLPDSVLDAAEARQATTPENPTADGASQDNAEEAADAASVEAMETFSENNGLAVGFNGLPRLEEGQTRRLVMVLMLPNNRSLPAGYIPRFKDFDDTTFRPMTSLNNNIIVNGQTVQRQISVPGFRIGGLFGIDSFVSPLEAVSSIPGAPTTDENFFTILNADALNLSPHEGEDGRAYATAMTGVMVEVLNSRGELVGYTDPRWTQRGESQANDGREGAMIWNYHPVN